MPLDDPITAGNDAVLAEERLDRARQARQTRRRARAARARAMAEALGSIAGEAVRDGIGICGAASITYGAWLIYPPAGFVVGGLMLLAGIYLHDRNG